MQTAATVSGAAPPADPIEHERLRFGKHRAWNRPVAMALWGDEATAEVAHKIANCSQRLHLMLQSDGEFQGSTRVEWGDFCNRRLCPMCEWRRTRVWRSRIITGLQAYDAAVPGRIPVFLTLTVRNCQVSELRQTIADMHRAWNRLTVQKWFPTDAWMRRTELTFAPYHGEPQILSAGDPTGPVPLAGVGARGMAHPHIHALLLVKPSYFSHGYIKQLRWQQEWQHAAKLNYSPIVDIRKGYDKRKRSQQAAVSSVSTACEVAKYAAKANDLAAFGSQLGEVHFQLKGIRTFGFSKVLRNYIKDAEIAAGELIDGERESDLAFPVKTRAVLRWLDEVQEYSIIPSA